MTEESKNASLANETPPPTSCCYGEAFVYTGLAIDLGSVTAWRWARQLFFPNDQSATRTTGKNPSASYEQPRL